jgi:hypothetical protein
MLLYSVCGRNFNHIRMKLCCILNSASISFLDTNSCCASVKGDVTVSHSGIKARAYIFNDKFIYFVNEIRLIVWIAS